MEKSVCLAPPRSPSPFSLDKDRASYEKFVEPGLPNGNLYPRVLLSPIPPPPPPNFSFELWHIADRLSELVTVRCHREV